MEFYRVMVSKYIYISHTAYIRKVLCAQVTCVMDSAVWPFPANDGLKLHPIRVRRIKALELHSAC